MTVCIAMSLDVVTFGFDFLAKHLETVVARVVDFPRLAFRAEVAVTGGQLVYDAVQTHVPLARRLLVLLNCQLKVENAQLEYVDEIVWFEALKVWILLEFGEAFRPDVVYTFVEKLVKSIRLCGDQ